jgi:hypothetical protein
MAHTAADGSKWTNAAQARKVPGRAQGDGKQPVAKFSKPEAPRAATASPVSDTTTSQPTDSQSSSQDSQVEVTQDGNTFVVTAKYGSAEEAHAAAQALQGQDDQSSLAMNPSQAMM